MNITRLAASGALLAGTALAALSAANAQTTSRESSAPAPDDTAAGDIVVTATRQSVSMSKVPISIAAFTQEQMDRQGVRQLDDLVRLTPGLTLDRSNLGANQVAIRGISSSAGAGTTGIYIDDTPIQVRNLGFGSGSAFPEIFDLERVEVLRGPQGTLFGAGSEGGTIRFLQARPNMRGASTYARAQVSATDKGAPGYEAGIAYGAPIVADRLGFRASVYYRRQGGWIDAIEGTLLPVGAGVGPSAPYGNLATLQNARPLARNANWRTAFTARLAVEYRPTDRLTLTPSLFYQRTTANESSDQFTAAASNLDRGAFRRVVYRAGDATKDPMLTPIDAPATGKGADRFLLPAIAATLDLGPLEMVSNTSYFDRSNYQFSDFTRLDANVYAGIGVPAEGWKAISRMNITQHNFTQEVRVQSTDQKGLISYTAGIFYANLRQKSQQDLSDNYIFKLPVLFGAVSDGAPFGPGYTAFQNYFGMGLLENSRYFTEIRRSKEEQLAGFAQLDVRPLAGLTVTAGLRVSRNSFTFDGQFPGALNNINPPAGQPCPQVPCAIGQAPFVPAFPNTTGNRSKETAWTPKLGVSYQATPDHMLYSSVAKGFRPSGAVSRNPPLCNGDLRTFGYVDSAGNPQQPMRYKSDSVWSYEFGAKGKLLNGALSYDGSVYRVDWKNIQTQVVLPVCLYDFVDNFGAARSEGFDLSVQLRPLRGLNLGATLGYNRAVFTVAGTSPGGKTIFAEGSAVPGSPSPWTVYLTGQYDFEALGGRRFYLRGDYTRTSRYRASGSQLPSSPSYNPLLRPDQAYSVVNARVGWEIGEADLSLFADNLLDSRPALGIGPVGGAPDFVYSASSLRPRTIGLTLTYRR